MSRSGAEWVAAWPYNELVAEEVCEALGLATEDETHAFPVAEPASEASAA